MAEEQAAKERYWKIPICDDDDDGYTIAITPVLPTEEPDNSLSMGDEHLDTIPATELDEVIKSSVEDLVPIPINPTKMIILQVDDDYAYVRISIMSMHHLPKLRYAVPQLIQLNFLFAQYDSFIFDLSINPFPPADRSDFYHEEFADELAHIISPPEYDHFCFKIEPELGNLPMDVLNDIFSTREPRIHVPNVLPTHLTLITDFHTFKVNLLFALLYGSFFPFLT
ncbi:hypothetical protein Tco_1265583 [Tanacetum coccineum]